MFFPGFELKFQVFTTFCANSRHFPGLGKKMTKFHVFQVGWESCNFRIMSERVVFKQPCQNPLGGQSEPCQNPLDGQSEPWQNPLDGQSKPCQNPLGGQSELCQNPLDGQSEPCQNPWVSEPCQNPLDG